MNDNAIENLEKFMNDTLPEGLEEALKKAVLKVEADSKKNCPVDDGILRASIQSDVERENKNTISGYVGSNVDYAPYVHQGTGIYAKEGNGRKNVPWVYVDDKGHFHSTKGQKPQPFITDAIDENKRYIENCFKNLF